MSVVNTVNYGLDIGGTKIEIGLFDKHLTMIDSWRVETPTENYQEFLTAIVTLIHDADKLSGQQGSIGLGMPGIIDKNNLVKSANIPCATGRPLVADLEKLLGRQIELANDCRLFALSECYGGAGDKFHVVYGAIIGTGAGGGLCVDGQLLESKNNIAGEYGHLPVSGYLLEKYKLPVRDCGCGLVGCCEPYIAGPGLGWLYEYMGGNTNSTIEFVNDLRDKKAVALLTFECYMDFLGSAFSSLVLSYDPDVIVVGGGISTIDEVMAALPAAIDQHLFDGIDVPIISKAIFGDSSGVRGAAILGKSRAKKHESVDI